MVPRFTSTLATGFSTWALRSDMACPEAPETEPLFFDDFPAFLQRQTQELSAAGNQVVAGADCARDVGDRGCMDTWASTWR